LLKIAHNPVVSGSSFCGPTNLKILSVMAGVLFFKRAFKSSVERRMFERQGEEVAVCAFPFLPLLWIKPKLSWMGDKHA